MFMGKKDKRGKDFKHPGRTRRRRGWRQAGPVGGRGRTSWRFPYIYILIYINVALDLDTVLAVRVGKYCIRAYGIRPFSLFSILPARLRPSSSGQWINSSGPIGLVLSASTHAIPLFSLFLHWPNMHVLSSFENDNLKKYFEYKTINIDFVS